MFVRNCWYCGGWSSSISQRRDGLIPRKIAGERLVLYRKPDGGVVAMEDRCCHRQAALSLGEKEGDCVRCMYHGLKFGPDGTCVDIPGQEKIPENAKVRVFPVVEKDDWIWVWMGDPARADESLIPFAVGPSDPEWSINTSQMQIAADYRLEIANLADLSHLAWVHQRSLGGRDNETRRAYTNIKARHKLLPRGLHTRYAVRGVPAPASMKHLFSEEDRFDIDFDITHTIPCTWVMRFRVFTAGTATEGEPNGELVVDTYTCQAVTPNDADSVDYYFSWGPRKEHDFPGLSDLLRELMDIAFLEDAQVLEAQHKRRKEKPDFPEIDIVHDAGAGKMLWVLDKHLKQEAQEAAAESEAA